MKSLTRIRALLPGLAMLAVAASPAGSPSPSGPIPKLRSLSAKSFDALPSNTVLELDGRQLTKAQFLAEMEQHRARMSAKKPPLPKGSEGAALDLAALRARLVEGERSRKAQKKIPFSGVPGSLGLSVQIVGP